MSTVFTIWKKEMRVYAVNPTAYAFLAVFLFLSGLFFFLGITLTGEASLRVLASNLAIAELFILPMLTMRHFAEERRQGTLEMLLTSPISPFALVLGKWLASVTLCGLMFLGTAILPAILAYYGDPDWGVVASTYLGLLLAAAAFCAAGLFSSSLLDDQLAAGLLGIVFLLPFWLVSRAEALVGTSSPSACARSASSTIWIRSVAASSIRPTCTTSPRWPSASSSSPTARWSPADGGESAKAAFRRGQQCLSHELRDDRGGVRGLPAGRPPPHPVRPERRSGLRAPRRHAHEARTARSRR